MRPQLQRLRRPFHATLHPNPIPPVKGKHLIGVQPQQLPLIHKDTALTNRSVQKECKMPPSQPVWQHHGILMRPLYRYFFNKFNALALDSFALQREQNQSGLKQSHHNKWR
jgi:hypothetical protein